MLKTLLAPQTPFHSLPFPQIDSTQFESSFDEALKLAKQRVQAIEEQVDPNFQNTIEALELASLELDQVSSVFFNLYHCCTDDHIDKAVGPISEKLADYGNDIQLSEELFQKIKTVFENADWTQLSKEQSKLLKETYESFTRNGALLSPEDKEKLRALDKKMASLSPQYSQNLLKSTNAFSLNMTDASEVEALPQSLQANAKEEAKKRKQEGWTFTLQAPSYVPFMKYMPHRQLREKMWMAYNTKALSGEFSNREICGQIAKLRFERAQLLGFATHADFVLQKRMAKTADNVLSFIEEIKRPSLQAAKKELAELKTYIKDTEGENIELNPWDFSFYSERMKKHFFDLSDEELRPYFPLEKAVDGIFLHAKKLYNLDFKKQKDVPVYNPEVEVFEVSKDNQFIGLFYMDLFPRENKKAGAWMTNFIDQGFDGKDVRRPHVSIVCNFSRPTAGHPSLLTFNEVQTLFHEFGHALHSLSSQCYYRSLGGTNVLWDFVELPSQIMENWTYEKESLDLFARHYKTGETMPLELIEKLNASRNFQSGYASLRQVSFSLLDLSWHTDIRQHSLDPIEVEKRAFREIQLLPSIENTNFSVGFSHIFAGGYSAGYYSYKWAEVLDADAFEAFKENGIFNPEVAQKFYNEILSQGGVDDPEELFKRFRGRAPDSQALLKRSGWL